MAPAMGGARLAGPGGAAMTPKEAKQIYDVAYRAAHRETRKVTSRAWRETHRAERNAYLAGWREAHRESLNVATVARRLAKPEELKTAYARHREKRKAASRAYYATHREERARYTAGYRAANPEAKSLWYHQRRTRKIGNGVFKVTPRDWRRMLERFGQACAYCGVVAKLHQEHVIPISRGGRHSIGNLLPACARCNLSKHDRLLVEWRHA